MTATFTVSGNKTTITMKWTRDTAEAQAVIFGVAENLWVEKMDDDGEVINPFTSASPQDKLDVAFRHVGEVLMNMAYSFASNKNQRAAGKATIRHSLEEQKEKHTI